jgi:hypothetical protein
MSIQLKEDEVILAQCMVQELTTLLTTNQLIIITPTKQESYPVQDILAIDVYDDTRTYNERVKKENRRKLIVPMLLGLLCGAALGLPVAMATKAPETMIFFLTIGISVSLMYPTSWLSDVTKESLLTIILREGETIQYRFNKVDIGEHYVKTFAEKVSQMVAKAPAKSFLNQSIKP